MNQLFENVTAHQLKARYFVDLLKKVERHVRINGVNQQISRNAKAIIKFFSLDENNCQIMKEQFIYPALLEAVAGSDARCIRIMIESQKRIHQHLSQTWNLISPSLLLISNGDLHLLHTENLNQFESLYQDLLRIEEKELFPLAMRMLPDFALESLDQMKSLN